MSKNNFVNGKNNTKGSKFEKSSHFDKIETLHRVGKYCHWQQCIAVRSADMITSRVYKVTTSETGLRIAMSSVLGAHLAFQCQLSE